MCSNHAPISLASCGGTLMEGLQAEGLLPESPCNGKGLCGKCKVRVLSGDAGPVTPTEQRFLSPQELENGIRLACMSHPCGTVALDPLELLSAATGAVLGGGTLPPYHFGPAVTLSGGLAQPAPNAGLADRLDAPMGAPLSLLRRLPALQGGAVTQVCYLDTPVDLRPDGPVCGLAVDLGTTTVAVALIDLRTGAVLGEEGFLNPQKAFGLDVLSRIYYDIEHPGGVLALQQGTIVALQQTAEKLAHAVQCTVVDIFEVTVAGNPTMLHALLGVPLASLGRAPYQSVFHHAVTALATELDLSLNNEARVYCLPSVSAFVGGDIVAGALATRLEQQHGTVFFIDIGTNGEMILARAGTLVSCSCAAGPALEGMNISCGMRAQEGAVERVTYGTNDVTLGVIGNGQPQGLCGSGLLEAVSGAVSCGLVAPSGRIDGGHPLCELDEDGARRIVLSKPHGLYLTQGDIRQVQLCKGAILSGFLTLLERLDTRPEDISQVLVAGQFGTHLTAESLTGAGLLPACVRDKITYVGNTSRTGALLCLLSTAERRRAELLARDISYVELATSPHYQTRFTECLCFEDPS